jgi:hypothetical protein
MGRENQSQSGPEENDGDAVAKDAVAVCYVCGAPLLSEDEIIKETCTKCQNVVDQGD